MSTSGNVGRSGRGRNEKVIEVKDKLRASKLITTFGPGSIYDLPEGGSVMVLGMDYWVNYRAIYEPRLAKELDVDHFGQPTNDYTDVSSTDAVSGIPVRDFPYYRVCPECKRLMHVGSLIGGRYCRHCTKGEDHKVKTFPPRLVMGCKRGHVEDFPWQDWCQCTCANPDLRLYGNNGEGTESDMKIKCMNCGRSSTFEGALKTHDKYPCHGERPWLGDAKQGCDQKLTGLMRGSSRVYFPVVESALLIPPYSNPVHEAVRPFLGTAKGNLLDGSLPGYVSALVRFNSQLRSFMEREGLSEQDVLNAFNEAFHGPPSKGQIKEDEWEMLTHDQRGGQKSDFHTERLEINDEDLGEWFSSVRKVIKLKEVIAIKGFTRVEPYDSDMDRLQSIRLEDNTKWLQRATADPDLGAVYSRPLGGKWLPGVELTGEGIFFQFNEHRLAQWEELMSSNKKYCTILASFETALKERQGIDLELPRTILIHSLGHQLIRQISMSCGYGTASLRERIYSTKAGTNGKTKTMAGLLIYTSSPDSEGTLGGLVAQADDEQTVIEHIRSCLESVRTCSQDPLCGYHDPKATRNPWGASCHSCMHVPETSCEGLQNRLLDRYSLIGDDGHVGYFYGR